MKTLSRRRFLQTTVAGAAGLSLLPMMKSCKPSPNDIIRLGFIGLGQQATGLMRGFNSIPGVRIVAGADVYGIKRQRFEHLLKKHYEEVGENVRVTTHENYHELLDNRYIDGIVICTPDFWHALNAIDACEAGKDVYLEKPLTFTIREGVEVVRAVRYNNRILAVGSQQRSDKNFHHAVAMVRAGGIGKLEKIYAYAGDFPVPYTLPEEPVPEDLNWDLWLGPNPYVHYNPRLNPPISLDPIQNETYWAEWRYFKETGGGYITDWGAHNFDIAQWGLDEDNGGPVEIIPPGYEETEFLTYVYANGVKVTNQPYDDARTRGIKFWGENGWIEVARGYYNTSNSELLPDEDEMLGHGGLPYETNVPHLEDFIMAMRHRRDPVVPAEIGHRTCTTCILGNISHELGRPVRWDPVNEYFVDDPEAEKYYHREYRGEYTL
ncbi:MAG: Gfo/Idh/MocA family oxidoreductase [Bacteroidales bacterium]